jgi:hypothetical protein
MPKRPLQCPFCENPLAGPVSISTDTLEISGGICTCGAVFIYDRTGHNLGATLMDALFDYNPTSNTAYPTPDRSTKKSPRLLFLKLKNP